MNCSIDKCLQYSETYKGRQTNIDLTDSPPERHTSTNELRRIVVKLVKVNN